MTTKYDLSLVPYDQIFAELARRYPTGLLSFIHPVDGKPGQGAVRLETWGKSLPEVVGLAEMTHASHLRNLMSTLGNPQPAGQPLDQKSAGSPPPTAP